MSTKFEQLLDFLVNEEMDKANELFHEIVVDKSREIYENLIAEEEDEEADESREEEDESVEESDEEEDESVEEGMDDEADESVDLEDSYMMDGDEEEGGLGGDATDSFGDEVGATDGEEGPEASEDKAIFDIKNAIEELEAAFAELEAAQGGEEAGMGFGDEEAGMDDGGDGEEMMGKPAFENRRMTREYTEKVGHNYGSAQKTDGDDAGAGTGEKQSKPSSSKSPISSGKGKPTTGATAGNILGDQKVGKGTNTGERPDSLNKGIAQVGGEKFASGLNNVDGKKSGVKTLSKVSQNSKTPGPVGSGTGDKAGQTSISSDKPLLKKL